MTQEWYFQRNFIILYFIQSFWLQIQYSCHETYKIVLDTSLWFSSFCFIWIQNQLFIECNDANWESVISTISFWVIALQTLNEKKLTKPMKLCCCSRSFHWQNAFMWFVVWCIRIKIKRMKWNDKKGKQMQLVFTI